MVNAVQYKSSVCGGSFTMGTACGKCEQCFDESNQLGTALAIISHIPTERLAAELAERHRQDGLVDGVKIGLSAAIDFLQRKNLPILVRAIKQLDPTSIAKDAGR